MDSVRNLLNIEVVSCHAKYLGLPSSVSRNKRCIFGIMSLMADFWWGIENNKKKLHGLAWKKMCHPKDEGARYFPRSSFLSCSLGRNPSFIWRSIFWSRSVLHLGVRWRIGDGQSISIYEEPWLPRPNTFKVFSPRRLPDGVTVSALIAEPGKWSEDIVRQFFIPEEAALILGLPLSSSPRADSFLWHFNKKGDFQ
ncbi:hypothetical protein ACOSP7_025265 [Xanthoceras sorbifolium]